jgi:hypothetical protein
MLQSALRGTRRQTINQAARVATAPTGGDSTSARRSSQVGTRPCAPCPSRRARAHHTSAHSCPCRTKIRHQGSPPLPPSLPRCHGHGHGHVQTPSGAGAAPSTPSRRHELAVSWPSNIGPCESWCFACRESMASLNSVPRLPLQIEISASAASSHLGPVRRQTPARFSDRHAKTMAERK